MGVPDIGNPVAHRLVDSVLQGLAAGFHRYHRSAEEFHPVDVRFLAFHVYLAHIDHAFQVKKCAGKGGGDTVLTRTGLSHDSGLAHHLG